MLYLFKERRRRFTFNLRDLNLALNPDNHVDSNIFEEDFSMSYTAGFEERKWWYGDLEVKNTGYFKEMQWPLEKLQLHNRNINLVPNFQEQHKLLTGYYNIYTDITQLLDFIFLGINAYENSSAVFSDINLYDNYLLSCSDLINLTKGVESFNIG